MRPALLALPRITRLPQRARPAAIRLRSVEVGGKVLTNYLGELISYRQWNMMDDPYTVNAVKERLCYVSTAFRQELRLADRLASSAGFMRRMAATAGTSTSETAGVVKTWDDGAGVGRRREYVLPDYMTRLVGFVRGGRDDPFAAAAASRAGAPTVVPTADAMVAPVSAAASTGGARPDAPDASETLSGRKRQREEGAADAAAAAAVDDASGARARDAAADGAATRRKKGGASSGRGSKRSKGGRGRGRAGQRRGGGDDDDGGAGGDSDDDDETTSTLTETDEDDGAADGDAAAGDEYRPSRESTSGSASAAAAGSGAGGGGEAGGDPLADAQMLVMNAERFAVPELLFRPSDVGLEQAGLHEAIAEVSVGWVVRESRKLRPPHILSLPRATSCRTRQCIAACPDSIRPTLWSSINLLGGTTLLPQLATRLHSELVPLAPVGLPVRITRATECVPCRCRRCTAFCIACGILSRPSPHRAGPPLQHGQRRLLGLPRPSGSAQ